LESCLKEKKVAFILYSKISQVGFQKFPLGGSPRTKKSAAGDLQKAPHVYQAKQFKREREGGVGVLGNASRVDGLGKKKTSVKVGNPFVAHVRGTREKRKGRMLAFEEVEKHLSGVLPNTLPIKEKGLSQG